MKKILGVFMLVCVISGCQKSTDQIGTGYDGNGNMGHITTTGSGGSGNGTVLFYRIF